MGGVEDDVGTGHFIVHGVAFEVVDVEDCEEGVEVAGFAIAEVEEGVGGEEVASGGDITVAGGSEGLGEGEDGKDGGKEEGTHHECGFKKEYICTARKETAKQSIYTKS